MAHEQVRPETTGAQGPSLPLWLAVQVLRAGRPVRAAVWRRLPRSRLRTILVGAFMGLSYRAVPRVAARGRSALMPLVRELFEPEIEFTTAPHDPDPGTYRGHEGVVQLFLGWLEMFPDLRLESGDIVEAGDCLVMPTHIHGHGSASGLEGHLHATWVIRVSPRARAARVDEYADHGAALEAAAAAE